MRETLRIGSRGEAVKYLQRILKLYVDQLIVIDGIYGRHTASAVKMFQADFYLKIDGICGPQTWRELDNLQRQKENAKENAQPVKNTPQLIAWVRKFTGKKETDKDFNKFLSSFWPKVGLPHYKTIIGSSYAWCALMLAAGSLTLGLDHLPKNSFRAISWDQVPQIDWKVDGIPEGAVLRLKKAVGGSCSTPSGNHVTLANGDCAPKDLLKAGARIDGHGGNQSNRVQNSAYAVSRLCGVGWVENYPPPKITKSRNCSGGGSLGGSER